jgi:hypothetical protein
MASCHLIPIAESIAVEIKANRLARVREEVEDDIMDAHADLLRLKMAGLLAALDGHLHTEGITEDDWRLAGMLKATSDATVARVQSVVATEAGKKEKEVSSRMARRHVEAVRAESGWRAIECAQKIWAKVQGEPGITRSKLRQTLRRWRDKFEDGLSYALGQGWIIEQTEPSHTGDDKRMYFSGGERP